MDQNELEIIVKNKEGAKDKQNCIKIQEGNTSEIEYMNNNTDLRSNNKYHENNVVKLEVSSAEEKESKM